MLKALHFADLNSSLAEGYMIANYMRQIHFAWLPQIAGKMKFSIHNTVSDGKAVVVSLAELPSAQLPWCKAFIELTLIFREHTAICMNAVAMK